MPWQVLVHPDVSRSLATLDSAVRQDVGRKVDWALLQLAATGRTVRVKGTVGQEWRRTPVRGNARYLWWTQGEAPRSILIRDVRHHDDLQPPTACAEADYVEANPATLEPRTPDQRRVTADVAAGVDVRVVRGLPGTGKTVSLVGAAKDLSSAGPVLYLTANDLLASEASLLLSIAGQSGIDVRPWRKFLADVSRCELAPLDLTRRRFDELLAGRGHAVAGALHRHPDAAWTLLRSYSLGHALPKEWKRGQRTIPACDVLPAEVLADVARLSEQLAERVTMLAEYASDVGIFRGLHAARRRTDLGREEALRSIIVDEVQDLTPLELDFLFSYASSRTTPLFLLLAGDESQTTQASGFTWGMLKDLAAARFGVTVHEISLTEPLRSAPRLNRLIASSAALYRAIPKGDRPRADHTLPADNPDDEGVILIAPVGPWPQLIDALSAQPGRALVFPDERPNLPASGVVFQSQEIKGLERRLIALAGLGEAAAKLRGELVSGSLEDVVRRQTIDAIRVGLSRATDTLVLLEGEPLPDALELHDARRVDWDELIRLLADEASTGIDRAEGFLREAEELIARGSLDRAEERLQRTASALCDTDRLGAVGIELEVVQARLAAERARRSTIVVARGDRGDVSTLPDAIDAVPVGGTVRIQSGVYEVSSLVVDKPVSIVGEGARVVLRSKTEGVLILDHVEGGRLSNVTVQAPLQGMLMAVQIRSGHWKLDHVVIEGARALKIEDGAGVDVRSSKLLGGEYDGLHVGKGDSVLLEDVEATGHRLPAIGCEETPIVLRRVKARESAFAGIVLGDGNGVLEDCVVEQCKAGLFVGAKNAAWVTGCRFHRNERGIELVEGARVQVQDSEFTDCSDAGVACSPKQTWVELRGCRFRGMRNMAIRLGLGEHVIEGCRVEGARAVSVQLKGLGASARIRGNRFEAGGGLDVRLGAEGMIEDNTITNAAGAGLHLEGGANPLVRNNRIRSMGAGITVNAATGTFEDNQIEALGGPGIHVLGGEPVFIGNRARAHQAPGLLVQSRGRGRYERNTFERCDGGTATFGGHANVSFTNNTVRDGGDIGIFVTEDSTAVIEGNVIESHGAQGVLLQSGSVHLENNRIARCGSIGVFIGKGCVATLRNNEMDEHTRAAVMIDAQGKVTMQGNRMGRAPVGVAIEDGAQVRMSDNRTEGLAAMRVKPGARVEGPEPIHTFVPMEIVAEPRSAAIPRVPSGLGGPRKRKKKGKRGR